MVSTVFQNRCFRSGLNLHVIIIVFLGCLGLFIAGLSAASPVPLFASVTGTDVVCSQENPCNLTTAVFKAADHQYVYVAGGTYTGAMNPMLLVNKDIRLIGGWNGVGSGPVNADSKANPTILDGEDARRVIEVRDLATPIISGFTIKRGYHSLRGGGIEIDNTPLLQIQDTVFYSNNADSYGGGIYISAGTIEITNCRFDVNGVVNGGGALMLGSNSSATIARSTFTGNTASYGSAIHVDSASIIFYNNYVLNNLGTYETPAISLSGTIGQEINFYNNIIAGNIGDGIEVRQYTLNLYHNTIADNGGHGLLVIFNAHAVIINNIFSGHDLLGYSESILLSPTAVIDTAANNLFWSNTNDPNTGTSPVIGDPKLNSTYHLLPGSAAINSGTSTLVNMDIDQELRPEGNAPDVGADEAWFSNLVPIWYLLMN